LRLQLVLERLFNNEKLSEQEAKQVLMQIADNSFDERAVAAFLTVFNVRPVSTDEFRGFREALLELCLPVDLGEHQVMDLCGTGGDGKNTFNISTLSSLVAAAAGVKVAKHGNRSVSSSCGSSNVLEQSGVVFTADAIKLNEQIREHSICFLHAPLFHPAMKNVAPVRQAMGVKTFFNMLGPLVNPARPSMQVAGVFSAGVARLYYYLLQESSQRFAVVYDLNGYDEISLTGPVKIFNRKGEHILNPEDFGLSVCMPEALFGGDDVASASTIFMKILEGCGTDAQKNAVYANAGLAVSTYFDIELREGVELARTALDGGKALSILNKLIARQEA